jgi:hypothetical protein
VNILKRPLMLLAKGNMLANLSIDTDPQQQAAASPLMLVVRSFLRYPAVWRQWFAKRSRGWLRSLVAGATRCLWLVAAPLLWGFHLGVRASRIAGAQALAGRHLRPLFSVRWHSGRGLIKSEEAQHSGELAGHHS